MSYDISDNRRAFIYQAALHGFQGSLANPTQQASVASIVREAEKLWDELREWEDRQKTPEE